jgi:glycine/D-amino acid oxidase-like deaminating enzyme
LSGASIALPARVDVAVVGGGLAGCAAAGFLARAGVDVVLLEAGEAVGGGTGIGVLSLGVAEPADRLAESLGDARAGALYQFCLEDIDLLRALGTVEETGGWWRAVDGREAEALPAAAAAAQRIGVRVESHGDALFFPDEACFDAASAVERLCSGVRVATGARVTRLLQGVGVAVGERVIRADAVVLAGGWSLAALDPWFAHKLTPVREQALEVAGAPEIGAGRAGWGWTSWRAAGGRLAVTGCRWATPHLEVGETDPVPGPAVQARLEAFARKHVPDAPVLRRWAWISTHGCDNLPLVGPLPGLPTWIALAGFGPTGPSLAVRSGRAVADGLLTGRTPGLPEFLAASRFG